jgi:hypothetical protein
MDSCSAKSCCVYVPRGLDHRFPYTLEILTHKRDLLTHKRDQRYPYTLLSLVQRPAGERVEATGGKVCSPDPRLFFLAFSESIPAFVLSLRQELYLNKRNKHPLSEFFLLLEAWIHTSRESRRESEQESEGESERLSRPSLSPCRSSMDLPAACPLPARPPAPGPLLPATPPGHRRPPRLALRAGGPQPLPIESGMLVTESSPPLLASMHSSSLRVRARARSGRVSLSDT